MITYLKTLLFEALEQRKVSKTLYHHHHFKQADRALAKAYRGINPYRVCKNFLKAQGDANLYQYGETPLTTMAKIARECQLGPNDTVIEMGAGRGRAALFLAEYIGCKVIAFEQIDLFVQKMVPSKNLTMVSEDMFSAPLTQATALFLYGTMLDEEVIRDFGAQIPAQLKVITVSYPLSAYCEGFKTKHQFSGSFPWGKTDIYLNIKS